MTTLKLLPLPEPSKVPGGICTIRDAERTRANLVDPSRVEIRNGVRYWRSNDRPVPVHVYKEAYIECPPEQIRAYEEDTAKSLAEYRKAMENYEPSEEELFEMRAAFGPGTTVVNVITGKKTQL